MGCDNDRRAKRVPTEHARSDGGHIHGRSDGEDEDKAGENTCILT